MEYFVIGDADTVLGFSIVGVDGIVATTREEAEGAWNKALDNHNYGVIIITEDVATLIRETVDRYLFSESFPLVVEISSSDGTGTRDLKSLVNEALGVSL